MSDASLSVPVLTDSQLLLSHTLIQTSANELVRSFVRENLRCAKTFKMVAGRPRIFILKRVLSPKAFMFYWLLEKPYDVACRLAVGSAILS